MARDPVEWYQVLVLCALIASVASWIIAYRYRRRMQQLMRAPCLEGMPSSNQPTDEATAARPATASVSLADNSAAGMRLTVMLIVLSCLIAGTSASIFSALRFPADSLMLWRVIPIAIMQLWPVIPAIALLWRWSRSRFCSALLLWWAATWVVLLAITLWRQVDMGPLLLLKAMAREAGLPLSLLLLVFLGNATRAIAPSLLIPSAVLAWSSLAGMQVMRYIGEQPPPWVVSMVALLDPLLGWLPWYGVIILFAVLPWVLVWWLARALGRAIGRAYSRKWFSDLLLIFTSLWAFSLTDKAVVVASHGNAGSESVAMYLPLLWIPIVISLAARWRHCSERVPTLLILRVFQQDAQAQSLFDHVVERWRLSGNTVMIAGTDLADRTLDTDDIFQFLDKKLAQRFIVSAADVAGRIHKFDWAPDIDGRYRVNECYCHDLTWQVALQALVRYSDVVLMDLRGFQAHNAGCRYELSTLAQTSRELRVIVLTDGRTDRNVAQEIAASGQPERFTWIELSHFNASTLNEVLTHLFA